MSATEDRAARRWAEAERIAEAEAEQVYAEILSRAPESDVQPKLDRVRDVCRLLGDPQATMPVVHLTGTNGKTSTSRMIERLLRESGLRTGRFTSPHLTTMRERIAIDGEPISAQAFVAAFRDVAPYVDIVDEQSLTGGGPRMSFFEVLTVMAFAAFADAPVDVAVIEVGMGGRWDATNVADGSVAVLTPIAMDHERYLGSTLAEIAGEKVGIIKNGATVISAVQRDDVQPIVEAASVEHGARLLLENQDIAVVDRQLAVGGQQLALRTPAATYADVFLPLHGEHQAHNALLAVTAAEAVLTGNSRALPGDVVETAFADVTSPGRLELVRSSPPILVDAAHNPAGIDALVDAVEEAFAFPRLVGLVGVLEDKDAEGVLAGLEPLLDEVVITRSTSARAMEPEDLGRIAVEVFGPDRVHVVDRLDNALDTAVQLAEGGAAAGDEFTAGVLATGSVTVAAEVRTLTGH